MNKRNGPNDLRTARAAVDRVVALSKERGQKLTREEAQEVLGVGSDGLRSRLQRYNGPSSNGIPKPDLSQYVKEGTRGVPYRESTRQLSKVISEINASHEAPSLKLVAERLGRSEESLRNLLLRIYGAEHIPKSGVLLPRELKEVLYLSIGDMFREQEVEFTTHTIAAILAESENTVRQYLELHKSGVVKDYLIECGLKYDF